MANGVDVSRSGVPHIDWLLSGTKWDSSTISYAFPSTASSVGHHVDANYFSALDHTERAAVEQALSQWSHVSGLTFVQASDPAAADISIYRYEDGSNPTARVLEGPGSTPGAGDIQFGSAVSGDFTSGGYQFFTVLSLVGQALGLKPPHVAIDEFPSADNSDVSVEQSVLSYISYLGGPMSGYTIAPGSFPTAPMLYDMAAIQHLYGANQTTNSGNTTYTFDPAASVIFSGIWDAGGSDTFNLSNYSTPLEIDL